ncbi:hypothetical protein [Sphingobium yanoikuyae]|jgi:hypothetical protein|uniref:hypothetical protein n=1 Tax=Sphingobium yanoikuyae TaxID=13690 RepID=UPI00244392C0|nr:hypothetical protein [Sphingobium yanoikuyae]MDH2153156.1 hypothetical protein [Sphingobium yanoikuyae]
MGMLDNEPGAIAENDEFWLGKELPFPARRVIDIEGKDEKAVALARQEPLRRWSPQ